MKKLFSFVAAMMATIAMNATVVTITPDNCGWSTTAGAQTGTAVDGVTASVTKGVVGTAGGFTAMRIYKGETLTISCTKEISAVVFTCTANDDAQYGPGCFAAQDGYSYATKFGTWTGTAATSVTFVASTNQVRATKIEVYLDGEIPAAQTTVKATVAEAIAAGMALDSMATSDAVYEVTGYVVNSQPYNHQYSNQIWFMADDAANTGAQEFEAYACVVKEDGAVKQVIDGDKVVLTGALSKYWNAKDSKFVIEIKNGVAAFVEKADGDHELPAQQIDTISVADAIEIGMALAASGDKTPETYVVKGFACTTYPANEGYTDQTWYMHDTDPTAYSEFQAFQCTPDYTVQQGDYMLVKGQIMKYIKNSKTTIEISRGTAVHGEGPKIDTIEVNVAQALAVAGALEPNAVAEGIYKVRGLVSQVVYEFEDGVETFYMADALTDEAQFYAFKAKLDKAVAVGDEVVLVGKIKNYVDPVQSTLKPQIDKGTVIEINGEKQGIENIVLTEQARKVMVEGQVFIIRDNKLFDLQGARVR